MISALALGYLICGIVTTSLILRNDNLNDDEILIFFLVVLWPVVVIVAILGFVGALLHLLVHLLANVGKHANR